MLNQVLKVSTFGTDAVSRLLTVGDSVVFFSF